MCLKQTEDEVLTDFILDYSDQILSSAEKSSFTELMAYSAEVRKKAVSNWFISTAIKKLQPIKARNGFDQKMAAAFAMELERETLKANKKNTSRNEIAI